MSTAWILRPIVWFAAASMVTTILHELAHASAAFALGVPSTLLNYSANLDLTPAQAETSLPMLIRIAGPVFCLVFGLLSWRAFRRARGSAAALPLLFFSVFGVGTFFGNLMSASFVGDFSAVAVALHLPMGVRYAVTAVGALSATAVHFWAGRELAEFVPAHTSRLIGMLGIIGLPVVLGTAVVILVNQPMPIASVNARLAESSFWLFAAVGALTTERYSRYGHETIRPRWVDGAVLLPAVLVVRLMVRGIPFVP